MKRIGLWLLILVLPLFSPNAQTIVAPAPADLTVYLKDVFHDFSATVVPLGWSKDGKFAYVHISAVFSPSPYPNIDYFIVDTVEDAVVWSWSDDSSLWSRGDQDAEDWLEISWSRHSARFYKQMQKAGIVVGQDVRFLPFPLKAGDDLFWCDVVPTDQPSQAKIVVTSEKKGQKTVTSLSWPDSAGEGVYAAGCFLSPWESRILVVLGVRQWVGDAASLLDYRFSGCLLTRGFRGDRVRVPRPMSHPHVRANRYTMVPESRTSISAAPARTIPSRYSVASERVISVC